MVNVVDVVLLWLMFNWYYGQGYGTGVVADNCSDAARPVDHSMEHSEEEHEVTVVERNLSRMSPVPSASPTLARSQSYRNIIEEAEETTFFNRYHPQQIQTLNNTKSIDSPPSRTKTTRL